MQSQFPSQSQWLSAPFPFWCTRRHLVFYPSSTYFQQSLDHGPPSWVSNWGTLEKKTNRNRVGRCGHSQTRLAITLNTHILGALRTTGFDVCARGDIIVSVKYLINRRKTSETMPPAFLLVADNHKISNHGTILQDKMLDFVNNYQEALTQNYT